MSADADCLNIPGRGRCGRVFCEFRTLSCSSAKLWTGRNAACFTYFIKKTFVSRCVSLVFFVKLRTIQQKPIFSRRATKIVTFLANKPAICSKSETMAIKMLLSTKFACLEVDLLWEIRM